MGAGAHSTRIFAFSISEDLVSGGIKRLVGLGGVVLLAFAPCLTARGAESGDLSKSPVSAALTLTVGRDLDNTDPKTAFTFEPQVNYRFNAKSHAELYAQIDRPTNPYENFSAPRLITTYVRALEPFSEWKPSLRFALSALELHRWADDGVMVRAGASGQVTKEILDGLTLLLRVGPYGQLNEYTQRTSGKNLPKFGLSERVGLEFSLGAFAIGAHLLAEQSYGTVWRNSIATLQVLSVQATDNVRAGVSHELLGSVVDETTGFYSSLKVFDSRESRLSAFVEVAL